MDMLHKIMEERMADAVEARGLVPENVLLKEAQARKHHSLKESLRRMTGPAIIAEVKKASPSAGLLREDYRPDDVARGFEEAGAAGISVLTEPRHFMGSEAHLRAVRKAVDLPVLRKDFMCDVYQVYEAAAWGADVILLIVAALERERMESLYLAALKMGLEVLVEAHTGSEVESALELEDAIIGVNSRNLRTLRTDLAVAMDLSRLIPSGRLSVAESGIKTRLEIDELRRLGYRGFLVGEILMREPDPRAKLLEFAVE